MKGSPFWQKSRNPGEKFILVAKGINIEYAIVQQCGFRKIPLVKNDVSCLKYDL